MLVEVGLRPDDVGIAARRVGDDRAVLHLVAADVGAGVGVLFGVEELAGRHALERALHGADGGGAVVLPLERDGDVVLLAEDIRGERAVVDVVRTTESLDAVNVEIG